MNKTIIYIFFNALFSLNTLLSIGQFNSIDYLNLQIDSFKIVKGLKIDSLKSSVAREISILELEYQEKRGKIEFKEKNRIDTLNAYIQDFEDSINQIEKSFFKKLIDETRWLITGESKIYYLRREQNKLKTLIKLILISHELDRQQLVNEFNTKVNEIKREEAKAIIMIETFYCQIIDEFETQLKNKNNP